MPVGTHQGLHGLCSCQPTSTNYYSVNLNLQEHELPAVCEEYNLAVVLALPGHP